MSSVDVTPASFSMLTTETLPLAFDASTLLADGESVSDVSVTLVSLGDASTVDLADDPSVAGNVITQVVDGSQLSPDQRYRLAVTFQAATDKVWTLPLVITVPF